MQNFSPMNEAFSDPRFNKYTQGPGQDLEDELQPATTAIKKKESNINCRIALKKVPLSLKKAGLLNLCNQYGKVLDIHVPKNWPDQNPFIYVEYSSVSEAEKALREIPSNKTWNIVCKFATRKEHSDKENVALPDRPDLNGNSSSSNAINVSNTFESKSSNYTLGNPVKINYPKFAPLVSEEDYNNSKLSEIDPERHFHIKRESRRAIYNEDPSVMNNMREMAAKSKGHYNPETNTYSTNGMAKERHVMVIESCNYCHDLADKYCGTCSVPYCSIECQKADWQEHIKYCKPMPTLISKPFKSLTPSQVDNMELSMSSEEAPKNMLGDYIKDIQNGVKSDAWEEMIENSPTKVQAKPATEQINNKSPEENKSAAHRMYGDPKQRKSSMIPSIDKIKLNSRVVLTSVSDSKVVYVRPFDNIQNESFQKLINSIQTYSPHAKKIIKTPERYDVFLAKFQDEYCRVLILNVNAQNDMCFVSYIDYGNTGNVSFDELRCINNVTKFLKKHTFKVILTEVNANAENPDVQTYLNKLLEDNTELIITKIQEKDYNTYVTLCEVENKICVNHKLNNLSEIPEATYESQSYYMSDIVSEYIPPGENVQLFVTDKSNLQGIGAISCILFEKLLDHNDISTLVNDYGNKSSDTVFTPKIHELCLAKCNGNWYRAAGLENVGDGEPTVVLLDVGPVVKVPVDKLRKMPKQLMKPIFSAYGTIKGFDQDASEEMYEFLNEKIKINQKIVAQKVRTVENEDDEKETFLEFDFVEDFLNKRGKNTNN